MFLEEEIMGANKGCCFDGSTSTTERILQHESEDFWRNCNLNVKNLNGQIYYILKGITVLKMEISTYNALKDEQIS